MKQYTLIFIFLIFLTELTFSQFSIKDTTWNDNSVDSSLTSSIDWKTEPGKLKLQTGENENLARNKYAYIVYKSRNLPPDTAARNALRLIDGRFFSPSYVQILSLNAGPGGEGTYIVIDLQAVRAVNRVRIWQLGFYPGGPTNLPTHLRVRAYTIYGGLDTLSMEKLVQVPENTLGVTDDYFDRVVEIRFLKITIDVIDQVQSTVISEIEVFGKGYLPEGFFTSRVKDAGQPVNWHKITWVANQPQGTQISVRMRTGNTPRPDTTWSDWSEDSIVVSGGQLPVYEPRRYMQYQIRLGTLSLETPKIDDIEIFYDKTLIAQSTDATITPQYSPVLQENTFTYKINITKGPNEYPIDTISITTPTPTQLIGVRLNGNPIQYSATISANKIIIVPQNPITTSTTFEAILKCTPFLGVNRFVSYLHSKQSADNPQRVDTKKFGNVESWSVITTGVPPRLIIDFKIEPNPFTPNGDGLNDITTLSFFLANIGEPKNLVGGEIRTLKILVYDLQGRLVKEIYNLKSGAAAFISQNAFTWDGRDQSGKLVKPGPYIIQVVVEADAKTEQVSKILTVVY
ncbi:MAG: hypothetical protein N2043_01290 [Ignavibacterium sp.]|nr:hypothetical protein [Ignavibacterium sp.]